MSKNLKYSLLPAAIALAAFFSALPQTGADATITMVRAGRGWKFSPSVLAIRPGQRVAFRNDTKTTHTATCEDCGWDAGDIQPGQTKFLTLSTAGSQRFYCRYHAQSFGMTGRLDVGVGPTSAPTP